MEVEFQYFFVEVMPIGTSLATVEVPSLINIFRKGQWFLYSILRMRAYHDPMRS